MISKASITRQRLRPMLWDPHYISTKSNLASMQKLAAITKGKPGKRILDLGCGYKPFKPLFENKAKEFIGIDFDRKASDADIALDLNKAKLPFADSYFDIVLISETLEHIYGIDHALSEAKRVLKKQGYLFVSTPLLFCEHGVPHDYYRFTRYFYRERFKDYRIVSMKLSNNFVSAPFVVCNQLLEHLPISFLRLPFIMINNIIIICIESIGRAVFSMVKNETFRNGLYRGYEGINAIMRK